MDMYGCGCFHNCQYCYARSLLDFRGNWNPDNPSVADKGEVLKALKSIPKGQIIRIGGMTDPFQPCEDQYHMTRWQIEQMNKLGIGYLIVTKGAVLLEKNMDVLDKDLAHIQISYTYSEGRGPKDFEHASPPKERIRVAERLQEEGFDVALRLSPYIPQLVDLKQVTECKVDKVIVEFLRASTMIKRKMPWYDFTAWNKKEHGYNCLSLSAKMLLLQPIIATGKQVSVCEDYRPHWKYFKDNVNHNPEDCCNLRISSKPNIIEIK